MSTTEQQPTTQTSATGAEQTAAVDLERFVRQFTAIRDNVGRAIRGKGDVVHLVVLALVAEGHVLVEDVPGVGKTSLAKALARSVNGSFGRIQFTPDLLPTDVTGTSVWNRGTSEFQFRPGPIFADIVLADEINRASPKTQSALLEAMAEQQVTVDGSTRSLQRPFLVIATQNPLEHEGTYPLPEAQLDRFLMRISVGYPDRAAELDILENHGEREPSERLEAVLTADEIRWMNHQLEGIFVAPALRRYLLDIADATRRHPSLSLGVSPRGVLALQRAARAHAASLGSAFVRPDDIKSLAVHILPHRLLPTPEARLRGITPAQVVTQILDGVAVPQGNAS